MSGQHGSQGISDMKASDAAFVDSAFKEAPALKIRARHTGGFQEPTLSERHMHPKFILSKP